MIENGEGGADSAAPIVTDDNGTALIPADAFGEGADVALSVRLSYSLTASARGDYSSLDLNDAYRNDAYIAVPTITFSEAPRPSESSDGGCWTRSVRGPDVGELFGGCARAEDFEWKVPAEVQVLIDAGCDPIRDVSRDRPQASGVVTGGYLFPVGEDRADLPRRDRDVDFFRPLILQFPDDLGSSTSARDLLCGEPEAFGDLPDLAVYGLHGFNLDFDDGAWGIRGTAPLPVLRDRNLGVGVGLDFYPQDDFRSTLAFNADVLCSSPWAALGDASAFFGAGPRLYTQSFGSGGQSSSSSEFGFGAVSGMTYGLGPVDLYGDIGIDYLYDSIVPVTHFGVGVAFGD